MSSNDICISKAQMYIHISAEIGALLLVPWFYKLTKRVSNEDAQMLSMFILCTILIDGGLFIIWLNRFK